MNKEEFTEKIKQLLRKVYGNKLDSQLKLFFNNDEKRFNESILSFYPDGDETLSNYNDMINEYIRYFMEGFID